MRLGGLRARFWRPQTSSLKPPGSIVGPPAFLWLSFPHSTTQLDQCGTDLLPGVPSFSARAFLKGLANVWEAAVSPLGGLQSAAHRRCAKRARSPAPSLSRYARPITARESERPSSLCRPRFLIPSLCLSPGGGGPPESVTKFASSPSCWASWVDFLPFPSVLQK